jgi:putative ABC transport system permease protein
LTVPEESMFWSIAWRNVWRNKKRSAVILASVASGLWAGLMTMSLMIGMADQMVKTAIEDRTAHIQIHRPGFRSYNEIGLTVPDGDRILARLRQTAGIRSAAGRSVVSGMADSPSAATGVLLYGIDPESEKRVSDIHNKMVSGTYFGGAGSRHVIIGQKLAEKLGVRVGQKIVIQAQGPDGNIGAGAFRVTGLYRTVSPAFDKTTVFAKREDVDEAFGLQGAVHEIAVLAINDRRIDPLAAKMRLAFPGLEVATWKQIEPEAGIMTDMSNQMLSLFMVIILLAMVFGITNTMLMGVLERIHEFGVIIALGMKHRFIFAMILLETLFLSLVGGCAGMALGAATIASMSRGIDLSIVSEGLASFGVGSRIVPSVPAEQYLILGFLVVVTACAAAVYPAFRAMKLNPVTAIRTY